MIQFSYSSILKKHTVRTTTVELSGRGVKQHHSQKDGAAFNVYSLSKAAFTKFREAYPDAKPY